MLTNGEMLTLGTARDVRLRAVGQELTTLLAVVPRYRQRWERRAIRVPSDGVCFTAVGRVLQDWWYDSGERHTDGRRPPLDLVRRALVGDVLTPQTLDHFVRAFDMSRQHEQRLWDIYCGSDDSPAS